MHLYDFAHEIHYDDNMGAGISIIHVIFMVVWKILGPPGYVMARRQRQEERWRAGQPDARGGVG